MTNIGRRFFVLSAAALPVACVLDRHRAVPGIGASEVRAPMVGQSWRYAKRDYYTGAMLATQVDAVSVIGSAVSIDSHTEDSSADPARTAASWGLNWLRSDAGTAKAAAALPSEVQSSWGMVLVDPHWNEVQVFKTAVPLWPAILQPGWHAHINTRYKTSGDGDGLPWDQTMKAEAWESISVPAGTFKTLRFTNLINFRSSDPNRRDSVRRETVWFAPETGRWAARESSGSFYVDDSAGDQPYLENSYRWELLAWS